MRFRTPRETQPRPGVTDDQEASQRKSRDVPGGPGKSSAKSWEAGCGAGVDALCQAAARELSCLRLSATPWTAACQAPLSTGFSR